MRLPLMFEPLRQMFRSRPRVPDRPPPAVPAGSRWYAVGDVHGRLDLFEALIEAIERDDAEGAPAQSTVVLLGDLVDRGPDSAGVVARARAWQASRAVRLLAGNHEEMFLYALEDVAVLRHFLRHGGRQTALSLASASAAIVARAGGGTVGARPKALPSRIRPEELAAHEAFIAGLGENALWKKYAP